MTAQELLALNRVGLLPLVGQTQSEQPEKVLPQIVEQIRQTPDMELQGRLFTSLIALMSDEEMVKMAELLIEDEELLLDTPYLRRLREKAHREGLGQGLEQGLEQGLGQGLEKGRNEGRLQGRIEGKEEGRIEGALMARRQDILDALTWRFDPSASVYREIEKMLTQINNEAELERLFAAVIRAESLADFRAALPTPGNSVPTKMA